MTHDEDVTWIELNGIRCAVLACSPHEREPLAIGHLLSEGWLADATAIAEIEQVDGPGGSGGVRVHARTARVAEMQLLRSHQTAHGCGLRHFLDCDPDGIARAGRGRADIDAVHLLRSLFTEVDRRVEGGGVHGVALSDGASLLVTSCDVARHCATDRAIGAGVRAGLDVAAAGLVSTARISGAMALKAARCGIGWIASRSIATSLAAEIAARFEIVLLERAGATARRSR